MKSVIIKSNKVFLRPLKKDDAEYYHKYANNKKMYTCGFSYPFSIESAREYIDKSLESKKEKSFVIEVDNHFIGEIFFSFENDFKAKIGYWIGEKYWGKGITTEAVRLITNYIFKTYKNIKRIDTIVYLKNTSSMKVLEKNKYKCEGLLRKYEKLNGRISDYYMFSKIR